MHLSSTPLSEMLEGENQYDAESHGKQDAKKGVTFTKFPPILTIHLKRFDFDMQVYIYLCICVCVCVYI